ncbi:hypothetical protein [Mycolicibacterium komossense]|uniref:Uncharacterized protein n=1 Tax=Mycolicibacterium komossense TaxID=1779 RepID=A0ABT3CKR2_9MYCO|nr:hypothetical protein [Mycolicibacterium komossense]MCV7230042.1 hypothetical protein [Mycolicibacterium komossense]
MDLSVCVEAAIDPLRCQRQFAVAYARRIVCRGGQGRAGRCYGLPTFPDAALFDAPTANPVSIVEPSFAGRRTQFCLFDALFYRLAGEDAGIVRSKCQFRVFSSAQELL